MNDERSRGISTDEERTAAGKPSYVAPSMKKHDPIKVAQGSYDYSYGYSGLYYVVLYYYY